MVVEVQIKVQAQVEVEVQEAVMMLFSNNRSIKIRNNNNNNGAEIKFLGIMTADTQDKNIYYLCLLLNKMAAVTKWDIGL